MQREGSFALPFGEHALYWRASARGFRTLLGRKADRPHTNAVAKVTERQRLRAVPQDGAMLVGETQGAGRPRPGRPNAGSRPAFLETER